MTKAKILVVEDDTHLLQGIHDILTLEDYDVITAENGKLAVDALGKAQKLPDLIVSDIMMPVMDGIEFLKHVRQETQWTGIPFIFLTAKTEKSDVQHGKRLGVDDYLSKPFDADDLLIAVQSRLERQRALHEYYSAAMRNLKRNILMILNHEFRTPLTLVVAYADMLRDPNTTAMNQEELAAFVEGIGSGAERLRRLVENFIMLVEIEMGEAQKIYQWRRAPIIDIDAMISKACDHVRRNPRVHNELKIQLTQPLPMFIGDREYLTFALIQLLDNAVKFSPAESKITIGAQAENDMLCLWVKDEGRGIPAKNIDEIWETFQQPERQTYEDQGAGSGLAIVRGVAMLHSGYVEVESEQGKGSRFSLLLPITQN
ncbi:MAG: hybrid sensor histidine kinase/response regulator [Chloroflexi bacterium]|nr:hybrid sensor histidine kinase/response regulator [Chloroflexota bacterium]